jgi:16S rRNA (uracil1498-N3)-methyltransferase
MSAHRFLFYQPDATPETTELTLGGEEHDHFSRVLRRKSGDTLYVTNGRGLIAECVAFDVGKNRTRASVKRIIRDHGPPADLVLALAVIRKDKFEQAFEQAVELGVTGCIPFLSANVRYPDGYSKRFLERLGKIAVSAMKQSFRAWRPGVVEPVPFDALVSIARRTRRVVVGEAGAAGPAARNPFENTTVVVGPEAGLSHDEITALRRAGAETAAVSPGRLRSETAATALLAALVRDD